MFLIDYITSLSTVCMVWCDSCSMSLLHPTVGVVLLTSLEVASLNPASQPQPSYNTPDPASQLVVGRRAELLWCWELWRMWILKYCYSIMWVVCAEPVEREEAVPLEPAPPYLVATNCRSSPTTTTTIITITTTTTTTITTTITTTTNTASNTKTALAQNWQLKEATALHW